MRLKKLLYPRAIAPSLHRAGLRPVSEALGSKRA